MTETAGAPSAAERRLAAARTKLILDHPFLGALVLRLPLKPAGRWCRTTATDARALFYNPAWIETLKPAELQFALAHEALHCALGHFARRGHRVQRRWDLACDFAINPLLLDEGLAPPPGAQVLDLYRGLSAEEIYPCLDDTQLESETLDEHAWDGDEGGQGGHAEGAPTAPPGGGGGAPEATDAPDAPEAAEAAGAMAAMAASGRSGASGAATTPARPDRAGADAGQPAASDAAGTDAPDTGAERPQPLGATEREHLKQQWQRHLAAAAQRAREAGKLAGGLARVIEEGLAPRVSWRAVLAQFLTQTARDDYTWLRPSRREGEALLPGLRSHAGDIVVALDTSGSLGDADLGRFVAEIDALKGTLALRITLLACDSALASGGPWVAEPWEPLVPPKVFAGGGGTDFRPVFDWVERSGQRPDALVYFTDAEGPFPPRAPEYPVLWLVKGHAPVPWGRRVGLD